MTELPRSLRSLRTTAGIAFRAEPRLAFLSFVLTPLAYLSSTLNAVWIRVLADAAARGAPAAVTFAAAAFVLTRAGTWASGVFGARAISVFQDRVSLVLGARFARAMSTITGIEHQESPEVLDRLELVRRETWYLHWVFEAASEVLGGLLQTGVTVALLAAVHPLLLLLPVFALPSVFAARAARRAETRSIERAAETGRLAAHYLELISTSSAGAEIRIFGLQDEILRRRQDAWRRTHKMRLRATWEGAAWGTIGAVAFAAGSGLAVAFVTLRAASGRASAGDVLLTVMLAASLNYMLGLLAEMIGWLLQCLGASTRFVWLLDYERAHPPGGSLPAPDSVGDAITFERVSFRYPGTDAWVLRDMSLSVPRGTVLAIVGENGAGKTTLVKLLARFYEPTSGRIVIDGVDLSSIDPASWRMRMGAAFQDFVRLELPLREAVGTGDVARMDDDAALSRALTRAAADEVLAALPNGLETQLGPTWPEGVELSVGQWQRVALARALMRDDPAVLVLDEPTAALDAQTEAELFERFAAASGSSRTITILVSHRFSTVRMADLIVVLDSGVIAESGSHAELVAAGGRYAELYEIQARAYR